jgi:S1-C subfamily serine protease
VEGSGFVYSQDRLMTNAHVVAGVRDPEVVIGDDSVPATVVFYDPDIDIAVLALDTGSAAPLPFTPSAQPAQPKEDVAILGYPEDGPFHIAAARIRSQQRLSSPDIYGDEQGSVIREVYAVRGDVRPGNSGGPLLDSTGQVAGVVFAASLSDDDTGYALTAGQVAESAAAGITRTKKTSTGDCAR